VVLLGLMDSAEGIAYELTKDFLKVKKNVERLSKLFVDHGGRFSLTGHNLIFDILHAQALGIPWKNMALFDTLIYEKNLGYDTFGGGGYGLKYLAKKYFAAAPYEAKFHTALSEDKTIEALTPEEMFIYNANDLVNTLKLRLQDTQVLPMFQLDMDYLRYVAEMVQNGIKIHPKRLDDMLKFYTAERAKHERKARKIAGLGKDFNFNAWQQKLPVLQRLVDPKITSTGEDALEPWLGDPLIEAFIEVGHHTKTISMLGKENKKGEMKGVKGRIAADGLVHTSAREHGTETSRTTTSDPNIQNWQEKIRSILVSRYKGGSIIHPDLSQIEYRLIAHETREHGLIKTFREGGDIHTELYKMLFRKAPKTDKDRKIAKTGRYAKIYGAAFEKFRLTVGLPRKEAHDIFYNKLEGVDPAVDAYKDELRDRLETQSPTKVLNVFGRFRTFDVADFDNLEAALRETFNWIFQSSAHDLYKLWMMECMDMINDKEVLFIDDVHDEFVLDVPGPKVKSVKAVIEFVSTNLNQLIEDTFGVRLRVPILADVKVGKEWS